ncbi:MAG: DNA mismatch endonuclease Vsr, partial [Nitrospirota bacterium]|nr:DNA mismatch endonuclease Vsr [Nitrospirota bacterium]
SQIMSRVRGHGNKATELAMATLFRQYRFIGWRRHVHLFGNPDFVFTKHRVAIFVDGCFWHSCPMHGSNPSSNRLFWHRKLEKNKMRDHLVNRTLRAKGWRVLRIWQHELRETTHVARRVSRALSRGSDLENTSVAKL